MNHNTNPRWVEILRYYEKKRFIRYGLTIPFLAGIYKDSYVGNKEDLLRDFLFELKKIMDLGRIKISYCSYLEEDIVGTINSESPKIMNCLLQMTDEMIVAYTEKYELIIDKELFSKVGNEWRQYTKLDIDRIKMADENID